MGWRKKAYFKDFLLLVILGVMLVVFGNSIFITQKLLYNKLNYALLVINRKVFRNSFRYRISRIYTNIE